MKNVSKKGENNNITKTLVGTCNYSTDIVHIRIEDWQ